MYNKIKGAVYAKGMSMGEFYEKAGFDPTTLMRRCEADKVTTHDVKVIREVLGLTDEEMNRIFFAEELA